MPSVVETAFSEKKALISSVLLAALLALMVWAMFGTASSGSGKGEGDPMSRRAAWSESGRSPGGRGAAPGAEMMRAGGM